MPMNYDFDASQYNPQQGNGVHPDGKFRAQISNTLIKNTANGSGGMFVVTFKTEVGTIDERYNLWNNSQQAVDIAHRNLSALSHATGVMRFTMRDDGAALRGAWCMIEVGKQADSNYKEIKYVYDVNGNEPGKVPATPNHLGQQPAPGQPLPLGGQPAAAPQPFGGPAHAGNPWAGAQTTAAPQQPPQASSGAPTPPWQQAPAPEAPSQQPQWQQQSALGAPAWAR